ncbi:MAG: MFS transporter [Actinobacteria bacterium]|nr:MAG: MFS transporter [Actinomycetota bacterium]
MGDEVGPLGVLDAHRRALTIGIVLVVTMVAFEALAVATALPKTVDELGGVSLYGWAFSGFMLSNLIGITVAGHQADARGPAPPLVAGLVLFGAGLVICGAAPSMGVVVAGRAVQGLGAGAVPAVAYVAIGRGYPEALRPRMFAVMSSAWVVPGIVGPGVAGFVAERLSWRLVFLGLLPLLPLGGGLLVPALRGLGPTTASSESQAGTAVRLAAGAGLLLGGLGLHSLVGLPLMVAGGLVGFPALLRLLPAGALRAAPGLPAAVTMRSLQTFAFFGAEAFLPLMLTSVRGQSTTIAGLALTAATLTWTAGAWVQARLATRRSVRSVSIAGLVLVAAGIGLIATVLLDVVPVAVAAAGWGVAGLGMGLAYSMASVIVLAEAPADGVGAASAGLQLADVLGVALGTGLGGAIVAAGEAAPWSRRTSIAAIDFLMLAVALLGALVATRLPRRTAAGPLEDAEH